MPIYEYFCKDCHTINEVLQKISDPAPAFCPDCGKASLEKIVSPTSFVLKGSGWYVTDYKGKLPESNGKIYDSAEKTNSNSPPKPEKKDTAACEAKTAAPVSTPQR